MAMGNISTMAAWVSAAGLDPSAVEAWLAAEPDGIAGFDEDRRRYSEFWRLSDALIERLPKKPARSTAETSAVEAIRRAGAVPVRGSIRGGTDGSRLSFMGLPCPNIFAGEHAFHSRTEWVSIQDMEAAVRTIVHLAMVWEERA